MWLATTVTLSHVCVSLRAGYTLSLKRLTLFNTTFAAGSGSNSNSSNESGSSAMPKLLPLGLVSMPPTKLFMMDVRMAVDSGEFQRCLAFFSGHLRTIRTADDGGVGMHTVRRLQSAPADGWSLCACFNWGGWQDVGSNKSALELPGWQALQVLPHYQVWLSAAVGAPQMPQTWRS